MDISSQKECVRHARDHCEQKKRAIEDAEEMQMLGLAACRAEGVLRDHLNIVPESESVPEVDQIDCIMS